MGADTLRITAGGLRPLAAAARRVAPVTAWLALCMALVLPASTSADEVPGPAEATGQAQVPAQEPATKGLSAPDTAAHHRSRLVKPLTASQKIDLNVRRLSKGLDLEPTQQLQLRRILEDQHRQIAALRGEQGPSGMDAAGSAMAIYEQTKQRIRGILNDEQQKKYSVAVPRDQLAPAQADLNHWMGLQEAKRQRGESDEDPTQ